MNELVAKINEAFEAFSKDAELQVEKGNKAALYFWLHGLPFTTF